MVAPVLALLPTLLPVITNLLERVIPDPAERERKANEMAMAMLNTVASRDADQSAVNQVEAANPSRFVSGWRPFIGWTLGVSLAWTFIGLPVASFVATTFFHYTGPIPVLALNDNLWELMFGMLGMAGLRTFERVRGRT